MDLEKFDAFEAEVEQSVELQKKNVVRKIVTHADGLVDELLYIIYNREVDVDGHPIVEPRVKLSAIGMLLDRGVAKLAVDNNKSEVVEESKTRRKIREEIEAMVKGKNITDPEG